MSVGGDAWSLRSQLVVWLRSVPCKAFPRTLNNQNDIVEDNFLRNKQLWKNCKINEEIINGSIIISEN
jgi:hypothetical protein